MMVALAQDTRLLPPVQRAVQNLEPALKQLVRFDPASSPMQAIPRAVCWTK